MDFHPIVELPPFVEGWPYLSEDVLMTIDNAVAEPGVSAEQAALAALSQGEAPTGPASNENRTPPSSIAPSSIARVATERPSRYGRQLVSHMGHKINATWDDQGDRGDLHFVRDDFRAHCAVDCEEGALVLTLTADASAPADPTSPIGDLAGLEHVIGIHLARFGVKDALAVTWQRTDGTAGTTQGPLTAEEVAEHRRLREERRSRGE